ncbi:MAG: hypothetical protein [Caudoviricetes sp.]|nr:MAG: hypothetical protein [Caudoviricetes sp.]
MSQLTLRKKSLRDFLRKQNTSNISGEYIEYISISYPNGKVDTLSPDILEKLIMCYHDINDIEFDVVGCYIDEKQLLKDIINESNKLYNKHFKNNKR